MIGKIDNYLKFNELALSLRSQRQQVLASNIANADTPHYKARDIDFTSAMQSALAKSGPQAGVLKQTQPGHVPAGAATGDVLPDGTPVLYRTPAQGAADNNTVDMDVERNQFADNALRYEAGIIQLNGQIKSLLTAIQGQ